MANPAPQVGLSDDALAAMYTLPCGSVALDGTEPAAGPVNGRYELVQWSDYACPHCKTAAEELPEMLRRHPDVRHVFKVYPLSGACNPIVTHSSAPERCEAAYAAECALPQGRYFDYSKLLFENQGHHGPNDLEFLVGKLGMNLGQWQACLHAESTRASIAADVAAGQAAGIAGTPTFFLKGTHGGTFIRIAGGVDAIDTVIREHRSGRAMPAPGPCVP